MFFIRIGPWNKKKYVYVNKTMKYAFMKWYSIKNGSYGFYLRSVCLKSLPFSLIKML